MAPSQDPNYTEIHQIYFYVTLSKPADFNYQIMADVFIDSRIFEANLTIDKGSTIGKCLVYEIGPEPQNITYSNVSRHKLP